MDDVRVGNVVVEVVEDEAIVTVNRTRTPSLKRPRFRPKMRDFLVCVLQVRDGHQPEIHPQVRKKEVYQQVKGRSDFGDIIQSEHPDGQAKVREENQTAVLGLEHGGIGIEMGRPPAELLTGEVEK